jgi:hypothetical protein
LISAVLVTLFALAVVSAARAVAREARRRRKREQAEVLRKHPELLEIAASIWPR